MSGIRDDMLKSIANGVIIMRVASIYPVHIMLGSWLQVSDTIADSRKRSKSTPALSAYTVVSFSHTLFKRYALNIPIAEPTRRIAPLVAIAEVKHCA